MGGMYFRLMKDNMFAVEKLDDYDSDLEDDKDLFSRDGIGGGSIPRTQNVDHSLERRKKHSS